MTTEERADLNEKIGEVIRNSGLEGINIKMIREAVCPLACN